LHGALRGDRPATDPVERAQRYDWDAVADQAERAYRRAVDGEW
ncbi:glycosyl transferase family 1, partial [Halorubrum sp. SD626R]